MATRTIVVDGVVFEVEYTYHKACRGAREKGTGLQLEPDEESSVELESVKSSYELYSLLKEESLAHFEQVILKAVEKLNDGIK